MDFPPKFWIPAAVVSAAILLVCWKTKISGNPRPVRPDASYQLPAGTRVPPAASSIGAAFDRLREPSDREANLETLKQLQEQLRSIPLAEAIDWIQTFLKSGADKDTGLAFEISRDHTLAQWPTFRTFLLDSLFTIDPLAAAVIGREILASPSTADEWALALRNVGLADSSPETAAYLCERAETLIANPAWQAEPSIGYLNAFDVLVHTHAIGSAPLLSSLIQRKDRKDLAHAGFLTLDRLVQRNPADVLTRLATDLPLAQSRPEMVAQQFARADIRNPAQRGIVKNWLLDPARTPTELRSFAGVYPNNNRFISNNLISNESTTTGADLTIHDREALAIVNAWADDPAFGRVKPFLTTMRQRLAAFVEPAAGDNP